MILPGAEFFSCENIEMTELGKKTKGNRGGPEYRHAPNVILGDSEDDISR